MELYEAIDELNKIPQFMPLTGVERMSKLLEQLGHPEQGLKIIHVAGTNGKGSVCAYLDSILRAQGYKVGLFTSPHLEDIRERIRIQGEFIDADEFLAGYRNVKIAEIAGDTKYAYFDYLLGIALQTFARGAVDYCIVETGLGGRLDATNAIQEKILNVITGVSLEHTAILGDTVEKIAKEKAGIIHRGVPVVFMDKDPVVAEVIKERAAYTESNFVEVGAKDLRIIKNTGKSIDFSVHNRYYKNDCFTLATGAEYQAENCAVALTAVAYLKDKGLLELSKEVVSKAVRHMYWPGRMEEVADRIYVDGAHNPEGIEALVKSAKAIAGNNKAWLFFSVVNDKDYEAMIKTLCKSGVFKGYVVTELEGSRKLEGERIKDVFEQYADEEVREFHRLEDAYDYVKEQCAKEDAYCFCTGSLYLVGDIKALSR